GHAGFDVTAEQELLHLGQRALDRRHLEQDVDAIGVRFDHALHPLHLSLDPAQPSEGLCFRLGIGHGLAIPPGGSLAPGIRDVNRTTCGRRSQMNTTPKHRDTDLHGAILEDRVVPPDGHWGRVIEPGHLLRIVDLEGRQAVDFLCYDAANPAERYNAADTMKYAGTIFLTTGHGIYSDLGRPLLTIVADTCGRHDTLGGCCSAESNFFRYGVRDTPNCRVNF